MDFVDLHPAPTTDSARDVSGHYAAHALFLMGRADRRRELHGDHDATAKFLTDLAEAKADAAYALHAADQGADADHVAHMLLIGRATGGTAKHRATHIADRAGYSPMKVVLSGYES